MLENIVFAYLCDILTQSPNMDSHIQHICQVQSYTFHALSVSGPG